MKKKIRGKTPSLISGSSGKPTLLEAKKKCNCCRCKKEIHKGEKCFSVPKVGTGFNSQKRYCRECFKSILEQTQKDLTSIAELIN